MAFRLVRCFHRTANCSAVVKPPPAFKRYKLVKKIVQPFHPSGTFRYTDSEKMPYDLINPFEKKEAEPLTEHEESTESAEWNYVAQLFPPLYIPRCSTEDGASGWKTPPVTPLDLPYFIRRTKNHVYPVYEALEPHGGNRMFTKIKSVEGDIWAFEHDLKAHILSITKERLLGTHVHEPGCTVIVKGEYMKVVKEWLATLGF